MAVSISKLATVCEKLRFLNKINIDTATEKPIVRTDFWKNSTQEDKKIMTDKNTKRNGEPELNRAENKPQSLLTCDQVGKTLGLCSATVKNWIRCGKIKALRLNQRVLRVEERELLRFQQEAVAA